MSKDKLVVTPKGAEGYKVFSVRLSEEAIARIDEIAQKTRRSRNELIGLFVDYALDNCAVEERKQ